MSSDKLTGKIVFYIPAKAYGFIKPDGAEAQDVFFHLDSFDGDEPAIDARVAFMLENDPNPKHVGRQRAKIVTPIQ